MHRSSWAEADAVSARRQCKYSWVSSVNARRWYGILEYNVPLDTVYVISEMGGAWAVMYISHSVMEGQGYNNPLNMDLSATYGMVYYRV